MNFVVTYREKDGSKRKIAIEAADRAGVFPILRERGISAIRVDEGKLSVKDGRSKWPTLKGLKLLLAGCVLLSLVAVALTIGFNHPNDAKVSKTTAEEPKSSRSAEKASPVCEKPKSEHMAAVSSAAQLEKIKTNSKSVVTQAMQKQLPLSQTKKFTGPKSETVDGVTWFYETVSFEDQTCARIVSRGKEEYAGDLTIPSSLGGHPVSRIASSAFLCCSGLKSLVIPSSVKNIEIDAIWGCSNLTSVTIPSSVKSVGHGTFRNCSGLTSVTVPGWNCGIESANVTNLVISEGAIGIKQHSGFRNWRMLKSVTIPSSVTNIGNYAFEGCTMLTSVTIPSSVRSFGSGAFKGCSGLKSVVISPGVTSIGSDAFSGCSSLVEVTIPVSVTNVGFGAFRNCSGLTSVTVPGWNCGIDFANVTNLVILEGTTEISTHSCLGFRNCRKIKSLTVPSSVTSIGNGAFSGCSGLVSVSISSGVTNIGNNAFSGCSGLISFSVDASNPAYSSWNGWLCSKDGTVLFADTSGNVEIPSGITNVGVGAFRDRRGITSVMIPSSVTSIGNSAFYGCSGLTSVTIPSSVTSIGDAAFKGCSGLKSVTIPSSVTNIGWSVFENCSGLTSLSILPGVTSIGFHMFCGCSNLTSVTIPSTVTNIIDGAFDNCSGLRSVTIPSSVTRISEIAFWGCSRLHEFVVAPENPNYSSVNGLLLSKRGDSLIQCVSGDVSIPSSVTNIADWAFMSCIDSMFKFSVSEENPKYSSVNGLLLSKKGDLLVQGVNGDVTIPPCVTSIGEGAFQYCDGLRSVMIPPSVTNIDDGAFSCCRGLQSVVIPSSVTSIGDGAFSGCGRLETIYVDEGDENRVKSMILSSGASVDKLKFIEKPKSGQSSKIFTEGYGGDVRANSSSAALSQIVAKVLPGYTFKRSKMKGCRVDRVSPDGFWTYRAEDSKTNEVAWADFYKRFPANFNEVINWFSSNEGTNVLGGCRSRARFLRYAADVIDECCSDVSGAKERCAKLRSQADELMQVQESALVVAEKMPDKKSQVELKKLADGIGVEKQAEKATAVRRGETKKSNAKNSYPKRSVNFDCATMDVVVRFLQTISPRFAAHGVRNCMPVSFRSAPGVRLTNSQLVRLACEALRMSGVSLAEDGDGVCAGRSVQTASTHMWATSAQLKDDFMRVFKSTNENLPVDDSWDFQSALASDVAGFLADGSKVALIFCPGLSRERISCACGGMMSYDAASKLYDELIAKKVALFEFEPGFWKVAPRKDAFETFFCEGKTFVRIIAGAEKYVGDIAIPSSIGGNPVVSVGSGAFEDCSSLTSVRIPSGVTNIAFAAFRGCKKLKSVTIPPSVTCIGGDAFKNCHSLESLVIPSSVKNLGYLMLDGCSGLTTLTISHLKGVGCSQYGALKSVAIPEGATSIESEAFRGFGGIEAVTIPNGVENIGAFAFYYCSGLKSVTIPTSVTNIEHEAFAACGRLESVTIPSSVTSLGANAFSRCPKLTTFCVVRDGKEERLTVSEFNEQWKSRMADRTSAESRRRSIALGMEKNARICKDPQTEITWCYSVCNDNTASLKPSLCFSKGMPTLSGDVVIPETLDGHVVTDIIWWDIGDCVDLTSLRIPKTVRQLRMNSASVFTLTNLTIEAGCRCSRSFGRFVLEGTWLQAVCAGGTKRLVIPEEVEGLVEGCFAGASWLEEVRIPSTVKKVAASSFAGCKGLYRRYDPDGRGYMVFDGWLIPDGNIKCRELEVPLGVRHIASTEYPERCWKNVTSVKFPEGLVSIGEGAFVGSNIETIEFPASLKRCDGFGKAPVVFGRRVVSDRPLRNVIFNSGDVSFSMPDSVRRVTFTEGVTDIGVVPDGQRRSGLSGGAGVTTIVLPSGLRSIHKLPDFPELTEITIPSSVTNIGKTVFQGCEKLKSVGVEKNGLVELVPIDEFRKQWNLSELKTSAASPAKGNLQQGGLLRARRLQCQHQEDEVKVQTDAAKA